MVGREAPRSHSDFQSASPNARSKSPKLQAAAARRCTRAERESGARRAGSGEQQSTETQKQTRRANSDQRKPPREAVFLGVYGRFAAVTAEAFVFFFAASRRSWRRFLPLRGGHGGGDFFFTNAKSTETRFISDFRLLSKEYAYCLRPFAMLAACAVSRQASFVCG